MGRLSPREEIVLREHLRAAFPAPARFNDFLMFRLNRTFLDYRGLDDDYPTAIGRVVSAANAGFWWSDLVREARNAIPSDPALMEFGEDLGLAPVVVDGRSVRGGGRLTRQQLELKIRAANPMADIVVFRHRLGEIEGRVCRVELPAGTALGTGFLVAADLVMTNYHVIEDLHANGAQPSNLCLRFDYKHAPDGVTVKAGTTYSLAADWLVDHARYSDLDMEAHPQTDPSADELDYALLKVAGTPGKDPVGGPTTDPNPVPRGWVKPQKQHDFAAEKPLFIVQHPEGSPMKVALDTDAIIGVNGNRTRVRYATNTEPGSSGSPCFNSRWEWVALHHAGDPMYQLGKAAGFNQGIPVSAIVARLEAKGLGVLLA